MTAPKIKNKPIFECTIPGRVAIKKNSKRLVRAGKRIIPISSKKYLEWERAALFHLISNSEKYIPPWPYDCECYAEYYFHFKNHQAESDCSNCVEAPQDLLQKAKVILNDKQIVKLYAEKIFDGTEKTVIKLYEV